MHRLPQVTRSDDSRRESLSAYRRRVEGDELSRRSFVKLLGASLALAGLEGCTRLPGEEILPYVDQPELTPGIPVHYATAMVVDGYATGVIVESHEGRPTKIEGNPDHPASLGAAGLFEQASVLQLYDPHRAKRMRRRRAASSWSEFARAFAPATLRQRVGARGERLRLLIQPTSSPLEAELLRRLAQLYPAAEIHVYAPLVPQPGAEPFRAGGRALVPQHDMLAADVIVAIDADFLASGPFHLRYARQFAERRRPEVAPGGMNRLYVVEPALTVTGAAADHRLAARPSEIEPLLEQLLDAVGPRAAAESPRRQQPETPSARFVAAVARDLAGHRGRCLVVGGMRLGTRAHALVHAINEALGNTDRTVWFTESPIVGAGYVGYALEPLVAALHARAVDTLICIGGNPSYATPGPLQLSSLLRAVPQSVYVGLYENETARDCEWMVPAVHYLESWGDARAYDGTLSIVQPLIAPLYGGKTTTEVLAALLGDAATSAHDLLRADWQRRGETEESWRAALGRGIVPATGSPRAASPSFVATASASPAVSPSAQREAFEIVFRGDARVHDGSFADNAWLQELPDPVTTLTWGNAAQMSRATADRLGVASGELLSVRAEATSVELPALIVPGHADDVVSLHFGYGRAGAEEVADGVGVNVYPLWPGRGAYSIQNAEVRRSRGHASLAITQPHWSLEPHTPARSMSLAEAQRATPRKPSRALSLYQPPAALPDGPAQHQWAMTIDLSTCIGCGACVVACQAENNIPVVGDEDVRKGREMHWLRVDRYVAGAADVVGTPDVIPQPMLCQHCEKAPCEYVCPVEATVHSPDGLNQMVYNRCVGTRFCSNNCPYKVRRFNWFDYNAGLSESEVLGKNPDVTVRERGVMEKCTFCVQRIREAEISASVEGRALRTDEVRTACQQACPTNAIVFGSLTDPDSAVLRGRDGGRAYAALEELGTQPRVRYLARVRNRNPELEKMS
jgi:Fe-S-cluster-containing dehydrogenase component/anaerobic selenocysteine-containing dehydrogenase